MASTSVLGCRVDAAGQEEAVHEIVRLARSGRASLVVTLGTEMVMRAQTDERFRAVVNGAALVLCDTVGIEWAARLSGLRVPRVAGIELVESLCAACAAEGLGIYLLGAKGDTAKRAARELARRHPGLRIGGFRDGYFRADEDAQVAQSIAERRVEIVLVALGSPRQEMWIDEHLARTGAAVGIGVGGSFDVLAGNVERAPERWRRHNVEWLYRLVREPRRWRRQLALPAFVWLVLRERAGLYRTERTSV